MLHESPPLPLSARRRHLLHAMGVNVYRRPGAALPDAVTQAAQGAFDPNASPKPAALQPPTSTSTSTSTSTEPHFEVLTKAKPLPAKKVSAPRVRAGSTEWALPDADLAWFLRSKMKLHLQLTLKQPDVIAASNTDASDTALYFDLPGYALLKLGGIARLRTQWRAKRDAWLALRMWRKTNPGA